MQNKLGKFAWCLVVFCCFSVAALLINDSYIDWQESPIATSITVLPLDGLDFPKVTVCPPKGTHTALNHDLVKANNESLTEEDKDTLKKLTFDMVMKPAQTEYIAVLVAAANSENLENVFKGFHSFPEPYKDGFGSSMWDINGSVHSPGFGGRFDRRLYERSQRHSYSLEFPGDLVDQVGNGSLLVIELEVDTREEEGWLEEVMLPMLPILRDGLPTILKDYDDCLSTESDLAAFTVEKGNFL